MKKSTLSLGFLLTLLFCSAYLAYQNRNIISIELFELKTLDIRYKIKKLYQDRFSETNQAEDVIIIGIDEKSLNKLGTWPWDRGIHGDLVEKLTNHGVEVVGFDVSFTEKREEENIEQTNKELRNVIMDYFKKKEISLEAAKKMAVLLNQLNYTEDIEFAEKIKETNNTFIGTFTMEKMPDYSFVIEEDDFTLDKKFETAFYNIEGIMEMFAEEQYLGESTFKPYTVYNIIPPLRPIEEACHAYAPYEVGTPDPDGIFRGVPMVTYEIRNDLYYPPLYFLMYLHSIDKNIIDNVRLNLKDNKVEIFEDNDFRKPPIETIPTNKDGYTRINYYGPTETFNYYSYIDILENKIPKEKLEGKIALVGYTNTAKGLYDLRSTPFDPNMPGVEIHATAIQNLIDGQFLTRHELGYNIVIIFIVGIILTIVMALKISLWKATPIALIIVVLHIGYVQYLFHLGEWVDLFFPGTSFLIMIFTMTIMNYINEEAEKQKIKGIFKHYSSPALVDQLMKDPKKLKLGGEKKVLTAFFTDIEGFTTISEKMNPEELVEFLNEYLTAMTDIIIDQYGTVDKYEGDAIMAIFGAPVYMEDHAVKSCLAALEYQSKLKELREKWLEEGLPEIKARIGINTGEMVVGNMGSQKRFDYTIMGDAVNLASRLEGANKAYKTYIMISHSTYMEAKDYIEVRELDIVRVKGKKKPVEIYEVICKKGEMSEKYKKMIKNYSQGIMMYREKEWEEAISYLEEALKIVPDDGPSKLYLERCNYFMENDPGEDWNGVYVFTTK